MRRQQGVREDWWLMEVSGRLESIRWQGSQSAQSCLCADEQLSQPTAFRHHDRWHGGVPHFCGSQGDSALLKDGDFMLTVLCALNSAWHRG